MKYVNSRILILFLLVFSSACFQEVIDVDLSEFQRQLVIEGKITNEYRRHTVSVYRASSYDDPYEFTKVSNAEVSITDSDGMEYLLEETEDGVYKTEPFYGIPGKNYKLIVQYRGGFFEAESYMPPPIELDSIKFKQINNYNSYELVGYFQDNPALNEKAIFNITQSNNNFSDRAFYNGNERNGNYITMNDFKWHYSLGDHVTVEVKSVDETIYNIYNQIEQRDDFDSDESEFDVGSLFEMTTFNISNISNQGIGIFSAESVKRYTRTVQ